MLTSCPYKLQAAQNIYSTSLPAISDTTTLRNTTSQSEDQRHMGQSKDVSLQERKVYYLHVARI